MKTSLLNIQEPLYKLEKIVLIDQNHLIQIIIFNMMPKFQCIKITINIVKWECI